MSIPDAVDDLLSRIRSEVQPKFEGEWFNRPGMGHCAQGFRFYDVGLHHGPESAYAKRLREKAGV